MAQLRTNLSLKSSHLEFWLCQLVGSEINKAVRMATSKINRRKSPAAMYQTSVLGTSDNAETSTKDDSR